ncbi:SAVED domain-containing protein [Hymenobacter sp. BT635]|uniref:SAVED domain-containing protein n=1 Tax=Hymenobacter nitidus TaxID=2880929 RepID=A0ABS8AJT7_9BACT|nr:SAVED domain-containing protein [Hymenobacter nitidus]MCB2380324.1 SAVED domain-containing protein [Hymenobacter nitidus]
MSIANLLLLRHSGLREVSEKEVLDELSDTELRVPRQVHHVDTTDFSTDIDAGNWQSSEQYLIEQASHIRQLADEQGDTEIKYYGLAEIPHTLALGALVGDERHVQAFDFDRDQNKWAWPSVEQRLQLRTEGVPAERVASNGRVAIRVEISSSIQDADILAVLGSDLLADIRIRLHDEQTPMVKTIGSAADAQQVRQLMREALAAVAEFRPGTETIHLFVAAPAPVCFLIGQELRLRNNPPFQTYRFRKQAEPRYQEALLLTESDATAAMEELTEEQLRRNQHIRQEVWPTALRNVLDYAASNRERSNDNSGIWYRAFAKKELFSAVHPFPNLPPLWAVANEHDTVDPEPYHGEFGHDKSSNTWRLNDGLLVGLSNATRGKDAELQKLIRLFLYHEYVHDYHSLTKYNATDVGRFPNCLERIDYAADLYALFHELDFASIYDRNNVASDDKIKHFLVNTIDLMIRSMWAFDAGGEFNRPQIRRVRRYLNWYWRRVQVSRSTDLKIALKALSTPPTIELAGCRLQIEGRRELMLLNKLDPTTDLSIGLVTENERMLRITDSTTINIKALLNAFRSRDHEEIKIFFEGVFEEALAVNGALPILLT